MNDYVIFSNWGDKDADCDRCAAMFTDREDLTYERLKEISPRYVFFPFWSWYIPEEIYSNFECVIFHMAPLPYGRGGSPLQNLVLRGHKKTQICALKCVKELDAGPIYVRRDFDISYGTADEIYDRAYDVIVNNMIPYIVACSPEPVSQKGEVVIFNRVKKSDFDRIWTDYEGMNL